MDAGRRVYIPTYRLDEEAHSGQERQDGHNPSLGPDYFGRRTGLPGEEELRGGQLNQEELQSHFENHVQDKVGQGYAFVHDDQQT